MIEIKPIYYSDKSHKYYFNNTNAFGSYWATTVYNGEALKGGEIKVDKNGRKYIMGRVEKMFSKDGLNPPWTQNILPSIKAARGRESNTSVQYLQTLIEPNFLVHSS